VLELSQKISLAHVSHRDYQDVMNDVSKCMEVLLKKAEEMIESSQPMSPEMTSPVSSPNLKMEVEKTGKSPLESVITLVYNLGHASMSRLSGSFPHKDVAIRFVKLILIYVQK